MTEKPTKTPLCAARTVVADVVESATNSIGKNGTKNVTAKSK
jgi:hypothetical protein